MEGYRRPKKRRRGEERGVIHIFRTSSQELSIPNSDGLFLPEPLPKSVLIFSHSSL